MPIFSASSRLTRKKVEDLHLLERSATLQFSPQRIPFCLRSCSISCWSLRASSPARTAKFSVLSAKMMPREELTINPQWSFMPYFATSSRLPPWAPTPGTNRKWSGTMSRMPLSISALVAPTTYIMLWQSPHS